MPHIHIDHVHGLSLQDARLLAQDWVQAAQSDWAMVTRAEVEGQGPQETTVWHFSRSGADGTLRVSPSHFVLELRLGFLLGSFKDRIEAQLRENLTKRVVP